MKKTKIVATIGPASDNRETLKLLIENGVNVVRLNMSHGAYEEQMEKVEIVRSINEELNLSTAILLDTKGPEVRTGLFENGEKVLLEKGNNVIITTDDVVGTAEKFSVSYAGMANDLKAGDLIQLDDGYVSVEVVSVEGNDLTCKILNSGFMKDRRGVNVPGVTLNFEFMSEKDKQDIIWACENDFDFIAASFIRNANDLKQVLEVVETCGNKHIQIIPKIESQDGVDNFDEILELSDGIMVARGDLGVEVPAEEVPVIQKMIISKCNKAGKMVITATQMLESMQSNPRPTRAEVSDVFNAVLDGSDAVMLSGESAAGDYPVESVQQQAKIAKRAEEIFNYEGFITSIYPTLEDKVEDLVSYSVVSSADKLENCKLIIALTKSGSTARNISRLRPKTPVLAVATDNFEHVQRSLALCFGVFTSKMESFNTTDENIAHAISIAKEMGLVNVGDSVAISAGSKDRTGGTNLMKITEVK